MSPIGKRHAAVVARLDRHFQKLGDRVFVWVQSPVVIDAHGEPEPDLALLRTRSDDYEEQKPEPEDVLLMIEVGDSTLTYELNTKRSYYAQHRIAELWIVDAIRKIIHVCREPHEGEYRSITQMQGDDQLAPQAFADFVATVRAMIG